MFTDKIVEFASTLGFWDKVLVTMLVAAIPVIELRGAIPVAHGMGLDWPVAFAASVVGNMIPMPFILLFLRRVFRWLAAFKYTAPLVTRLVKRAHLKSRTVRRYAGMGLIVFVAIPLPGTGAWSGALIASVLDMRMKRALPAILIGVLIAGAAVTLLSMGVRQVFA